MTSWWLPPATWNRTEPTGYRIIKLDAAGNYIDVEDFITGWLTPEGALGRPVDILIKEDGVAFFADDKADHGWFMRRCSNEELINPLNDMRAINLTSLTTMMTWSGAQRLQSSITPYGKRFLAFVSSQEKIRSIA